MCGAACLVAALYSLPQLIYSASGGSGAFLLQEDEPAYVARVARAAQGHSHVGNPWLWEHAGDPTPLPTLAENVLALPARAFALVSGDAPSVDTLVILWRLFLPALGLFALVAALRSLGMKRGLTLSAAFVVFVSPGLVTYKPLGALLFGATSLPLDRFTNPLFPLVTFFLAWAASARALLASSRKGHWAAASGALTALHFYISVYYWTHLVLAMLIAALALGIRSHWKVVAIYLVTVALFSIPYWVSLRAVVSNPAYELYAWRNGLLLHDRGWYLFAHKALWVMVAACVPLFWRREPGARILLGGILAGLGCYFSPIITGLSLQNFHWHYTLAPMLIVGVFWSGSEVIDRVFRGRPKWLTLLGALSLATVSADALVATLRWSRILSSPLGPMGVGSHDRAYAGAWRWLKSHAPPDAVVAAGEETMPGIPMHTGLRVWTDLHNNAELVSFDEIRKRYLLIWALEHENPVSLRERLCPKAPLPVAQWDVGLSQAQVDHVKRLGLPAIDVPLSCDFADVSVSGYAGGNDEIAALGHSFRLDYVVMGPNERGWAPEDILELEPVHDAGGIRVLRVIAWRPARN